MSLGLNLWSLKNLQDIQYNNIIGQTYKVSWNNHVLPSGVGNSVPMVPKERAEKAWPCPGTMPGLLHPAPPLPSDRLCLGPEMGQAVPSNTSSTHTLAPDPCISPGLTPTSLTHSSPYWATISLCSPMPPGATARSPRHWQTPHLREYLVRGVPSPLWFLWIC